MINVIADVIRKENKKISEYHFKYSLDYKFI